MHRRRRGRVRRRLRLVHGLWSMSATQSNDAGSKWFLSTALAARRGRLTPAPVILAVCPWTKLQQIRAAAAAAAAAAVWYDEDVIAYVDEAALRRASDSSLSREWARDRTSQSHVSDSPVARDMLSKWYK